MWKVTFSNRYTKNRCIRDIYQQKHGLTVPGIRSKIQPSFMFTVNRVLNKNFNPSLRF